VVELRWAGLSIFAAAEYPGEWAMTMNNLGAAYFALAKREDRAGNLRRAAERFEEALRFANEQSVSYLSQEVEENLGRPRRKLGEGDGVEVE
jgi:tetratricopeptide (TPR) repeat protein